MPIDVEGYIRLGQYLRREMPADSLIPPYCYRPLVPLAASLLPFDVQTSINLINILCLLVAMGVLDQALRLAGFSGRRRNLGCALFAFSFPSFYYGAIGFVDPAAVLVTTLLAYLTLRERHGLFAATLILGVLAKETNGLMALLPAAWAWAQARMTALVVKRTAYTDGRVIWIAYPFLIPLALASGGSARSR